MAKKQAGGESEHHIVGVRMRVTGEGDLKLRLTDLDQVQTSDLADIAMQTTTRFEPTVLANFQSQRIRLEGRTEAKDDRFVINRIIIFIKPVAMEYPS